MVPLIQVFTFIIISWEPSFVCKLGTFITTITIITVITWVIIMLSASSGGAMAQSWISPLAKIA